MSPWRWWLGGAALLVALPVAAIGVLVAAVDPNDYKPQVAADVLRSTGRVLTIGGPLRISHSLWPTIEASDVTLANLPGGSRPDMAHAERIAAELSLPALLWRQVEVTRLTLIGPNILFEQVGGVPNWVFHDDAAAVPTPAPSQPIVATTVRFRKVHVQNGMVTLRLPGRTRVVGLRSLDLAHATDDGPLDLAAVLVYADNQPFTLSASAIPTGAMAAPWRTALHFAAFDTQAAATGMVALSGAYDLQVDARSGTLEALNKLLPMGLPALRQLSVTTQLVNGAAWGDLPQIGATRLHIGSGDLRDHVPGLMLGAVEVSTPAAHAPATVAGAFSLAGQEFALTGSVGVPDHAGVPVDLLVQGRSAAKVTVRAKGKLGVAAGRFGGLDMTVAVRAPALAALSPLASRPLPALTDLTLEGVLVVPADAGSASLHDAALSTRQGDLAGDATAAPGRLQAKLRSSRLDLDAMLVAFGVDPGAPAGVATGPVIPATPLPWATLRGPAVTLDATVAALTYQRQVWPEMRLALRLDHGALRIDPLQMTLPSGPVTLSLTADAATDVVPVSLELHAPGLPLALITQIAGLPGPAEGAMRIDASLRATGRSPRDLAASLDGEVAASMTGGSLSNAALLRLAAAAVKELGADVPAGGRTAIRCLGLAGSFAHGVGRFPTIAIDTSYLQLDGVGQVDLRTETLALKLHPLAQVGGSAVSVPVLIEGPFRALQGRLDASGLDKVGLLIDGLFGGDRPDTCAGVGKAQ